MLHKLNTLPVQVLLAVAGALLLQHHIPAPALSFFYALSLSLKEILVLFIPLIVISFIFLSLTRMQTGVILLLSCLLLSVCASNFISTMIAYGAGNFFLAHSNIQVMEVHTLNAGLIPLWHLQAPSWLSTDKALLSGLLLALFCIKVYTPLKQPLSHLFQTFNGWFLGRFFIPLVPLFIFGFVLKMDHDNMLGFVFEKYGLLILFIITLQIIYPLIVLLLFAKGNIKKWLTTLKNMAPAIMTGFSSMSSAAALPLTLKGAAKNTNNDPLIQTTIPATVNIHLVGDSLGLPILALAILLTFKGSLPPLDQYMQFVLAFVMIKFAVAAVPGGGVIVLVPILEKSLGFNGEMTALITAIYVLSDPINTGVNVMGNSVFTLLFQSVWRRYKPRSEIEPT